MAKISLRYVPYQERHPLVYWAFRQRISLKDICAKIGVTRVALNHWDTGRARPGGRALSSIIEFTNGEVTPDACHAYWRVMQAKREAA